MLLSLSGIFTGSVYFNLPYRHCRLFTGSFCPTLPYRHCPLRLHGHFEVIMNVLVNSFRFISMPMLWYYDHYNYLLFQYRGSTLDVIT